MRKVFTNNLPRDKRGRISWKFTKDYLIHFIYDDMEGWFDIIDYNIKTQKLTIAYEDFITSIKTNNFINANLDRVIKEIKSKTIINSNIKWSNEEIKILENNYSSKSNNYLRSLLPERTILAINAQAQKYGLKKSEHRLLESKLENLDTVNNFNYKEEGFSNIQDFIKAKHKNDKAYIKNLNEAFNQYKQILDEEKGCFSNGIVTKDNIIILFKYYLYKTNKKVNKEFLLKQNYTELCVNSKLDSMIQKYYSGYYDFICACFPKYNLKVWEFVILDCPNKFWYNKYNIYHCIRESINKMFNEKIILSYSEIFQTPQKILVQYFHSSISYFGKGLKYNIISYLDFIKADYKIDKLYEGILFDSVEELYVYKQLKTYNCNIIKNVKLKFRNEKYNENYIPDFLIENKIIIEYFGMYDPNNTLEVYQKYVDKTNRKIEFFSNLEGFIFIPIFPNELYGNKIQDKLNKHLKGGDKY